MAAVPAPESLLNVPVTGPARGRDTVELGAAGPGDRARPAEAGPLGPRLATMVNLGFGATDHDHRRPAAWEAAAGPARRRPGPGATGP